jgi:membrane protein DedA with SNARE-associated domain
MEEMTGPLTQYGLALVFANVLITQLGAPLPAIPTLIVAGAFAQQGHWPAAAVVGIAVVASLFGDLPWFYAGRRYGNRALNALCRIAIEPDSCVRQTENIFGRWGPPSLMFAKFIPGFATVAPPIAGAFRLALAPFLVYSAIGALLWAGAAVAVGVIFHAEVDSAIRLAAEMGGWAVLAIGVIAGFYIAVKWLERWFLVRFLRMVRITVDELHDQMQSGAPPVILDARSAAARKLDPRRIPGAVIVDANAPALHADVRPDRDVVVYCT